MISYIIWALVIYLLFRFIFNFVIPLIRAGNQMRRQVRDFHERMNQQQQQQHSNYNSNTASHARSSKSENGRRKEEDYIDFEEIK